MEIPQSPYAAWIGKTETTEDLISLAPAQGAAALLDDTSTPFADGAPLPPLWHWFYFLPKAPQSEIGPDGHPMKGSFMPPFPLPRRMFAGGRTTFHRPLVVGEPAEKTTAILAVSEKSGKSGSLGFVTLGVSLRQRGQLCIEEQQDIVYRGAATAAVPAPQPAPLPEPPAGAATRLVAPDPVMLFRFSALTFNAHRIHYDRSYATTVEGYPGLVVHGPLTAILLFDLVRRDLGRAVRRLQFRAQAPLFDLAPFRVTAAADGDHAKLEAHGPDGAVAMAATAELA